MLNWSQRFSIFCFLDNQQYNITPHTFECLLAVGADAVIQAGANTLQDIDAALQKGQWLFGHLSYESEHQNFGITPRKKNKIGFPDFYFFKPRVVLYIKNNLLYIDAENPTTIYNELEGAWAFEKVAGGNINLQPQLTKEQYLQGVQQLQKHILRGDCYEINFCQEFFAEDAVIDAYEVFKNLMLLSPNPFAALYRLQHQYLICASPERFLKKEGTRLFAQPIKGTAKKSNDAAADKALADALYHSKKERAENVMVVDLMRNDLSKICARGSVAVEELFGIYTFPQLHQMISTISGTLKPGVPFSEIMGATFPMGSMTGAPKKRVLQLIDAYEPAHRGIFSGSVGYITPGGDFDFNVVIRSIMYNAATQYLSYQVGSGITFYCDAEKEWEECLLKGSAIKKVLTA